MKDYHAGNHNMLELLHVSSDDGKIEKKVSVDLTDYPMSVCEASSGLTFVAFYQSIKALSGDKKKVASCETNGCIHQIRVSANKLFAVTEHGVEVFSVPDLKPVASKRYVDTRSLSVGKDNLWIGKVGFDLLELTHDLKQKKALPNNNSMAVVGISSTESHVFCSDHREGQLVVLDRSTDDVVQTLKAPGGWIGGMSLHEDRLYVAVGAKGVWTLEVSS